MIRICRSRSRNNVVVKKSSGVPIDGLGHNGVSSVEQLKIASNHDQVRRISSIPFVPLRDLFKSKESDYKYKKVDMFSSAEIRFYKVLEMIFNGQYRIFSKVRILDVIRPLDSGWESKYSRWHIAQRHLDYVLCSSDFSVACVIELDDRSHEYHKSKDDDLNSIFTSVGIPLVRFPVLSWYDTLEVRDKINFAISKKSA